MPLLYATSKLQISFIFAFDFRRNTSERHLLLAHVYAFPFLIFLEGSPVILGKYKISTYYVCVCSLMSCMCVCICGTNLGVTNLGGTPVESSRVHIHALM